MNDMRDEKLTGYYKEADSWAADQLRSRQRSQRLAWVLAGVASTIAMLEAVAIIALTPLKTVVPYTLLVDRQTGFVQALKPMERDLIAPDAALTRSLLAQYVLAREGFDIDSLKDDYRKVALWSADDARAGYITKMAASNPESALVSLPRRTLVQAEIRSVSSLSNDTALIRFSTIRTDPGGRPQAPMAWAAVVKYRFVSAAMSESDRLANPLGFQVVRYRRNAEVSPLASTLPQIGVQAAHPVPMAAQEPNVAGEAVP